MCMWIIVDMFKKYQNQRENNNHKEYEKIRWFNYKRERERERALTTPIRAYRRKKIAASTLIRDNKALMNWSMVKLKGEKRAHER